MLIDTHAHLTDEVYGGADSVISSMESDGLERIITVAYDLPSAYLGVALSQKHKNIFCAVGIHPDNSQSLIDDPCDELIALAKSPKCVAIGEIGLDYHYESTQKEKQNFWFDRQMEIVGQTCLPVCFHVRDAYEDFQDAIERTKHNIKSSAIMHCYSGSLETALYYVDKGFYISFSGSITLNSILVNAPSLTYVMFEGAVTVGAAFLSRMIGKFTIAWLGSLLLITRTALLSLSIGASAAERRNFTSREFPGSITPVFSSSGLSILIQEFPSFVSRQVMM